MLFLLVITPREGIGWSEHYTRVHQPQVIIVFPPDMNSATTSSPHHGGFVSYARLSSIDFQLKGFYVDLALSPSV